MANEDSSEHVLSKAITCYQIETGRDGPLFTTRLAAGVPARCAGRRQGGAFVRSPVLRSNSSN